MLLKLHKCSSILNIFIFFKALKKKIYYLNFLNNPPVKHISKFGKLSKKHELIITLPN